MACLWAVPVFSQQQILQKETVHLRNGGDREWTAFAERADPELKLIFSAQAGVLDHTLEFTQTDVKQPWRVLVNSKDIGALVQDEKRLTTYLRIPASVLKNEGNVLTIRSDNKVPDDITVSDLIVHRGAVANLMSAEIKITITDDTLSILPGRITIVNDRRSLQSVATANDKEVAIRPGCIYTAHTIVILVPAPGTYTVYANRGFEYGVDSVVVNVKPGDAMKHRFTLQKEVDTKGWISSDTHVHTFTYSRHGDATLPERALTL
ncbi:MAG TPA: hypothetical protein VK658_18370, partial [Chryseolinea sp.]|nr:hypothetical protein [Chryseolinea sp.]